MIQVTRNLSKNELITIKCQLIRSDILILTILKFEKKINPTHQLFMPETIVPTYL